MSIEDMFFSEKFESDRKKDKDVETLISSYDTPEHYDKLALNIFSALQTIKEPVSDLEKFGRFKGFFKKYSVQEEFIKLIREDPYDFLKDLSKICDFLIGLNELERSTSSDPKSVENLSKISNELFKTAFQYVEATECVLKKTDWMKSFAFLDELEKDQASVLGISVATSDTESQIIPSWALSSQTGASLSLHSIDPTIGCKLATCIRAEKLGVTLEKGNESQQATSLDKNVKINLHKSLFPLYRYAPTPVSEAFFQKFKKILSDKLKRGDTVILGDHHAGTYIDPMLARLFNELKTEQPDCRFILHVQGGRSQSIYYQTPFDFEGHHQHFQQGSGQYLHDGAVYHSCIVAQLPALKQAPTDYKNFAESSICNKEEVPTFLTTKTSTPTEQTKP